MSNEKPFADVKITHLVRIVKVLKKETQKGVVSMGKVTDAVCQWSVWD